MYIPKPKQAIQTEETFVLLKPDCSNHHQKIMDLFYDKGFQVTAKNFKIGRNTKDIEEIVNLFPSVLAVEEREKEEAKQRAQQQQQSGMHTASSRSRLKKTSSFSTNMENSASSLNNATNNNTQRITDENDDDVEDGDDEAMTIVWRNRRGSDAHNAITKEILAIANRTNNGGAAVSAAAFDDLSGGTPRSGAGGSGVSETPLGALGARPSSQNSSVASEFSSMSNVQHQQQQGGLRGSSSSGNTPGQNALASTTAFVGNNTLPTVSIHHSHSHSHHASHPKFSLPNMSSEELRERHKQHLLSGGTCLAVILSGVEAISRAIQLSGPDNPLEAQHVAPRSIRAMYGKDHVENAIFVASTPKDASVLISTVFGFETKHQDDDEDDDAEDGNGKSTRGGSAKQVGFRSQQAGGPLRPAKGADPYYSAVNKNRLVSSTTTATTSNDGGASGGAASSGRRTSTGSIGLGGDLADSERPDDDILGLETAAHGDLVDRLKQMGLTAEDLVGEDDPLLALAMAVVVDAPNVPDKLSQQRLRAIYEDIAAKKRELSNQAKLLRARELDMLLREQELQRRLDSLECNKSRQFAISPGARRTQQPGSGIVGITSPLDGPGSPVPTAPRHGSAASRLSRHSPQVLSTVQQDGITTPNSDLNNSGNPMMPHRPSFGPLNTSQRLSRANSAAKRGIQHDGMIGGAAPQQHNSLSTPAPAGNASKGVGRGPAPSNLSPSRFKGVHMTHSPKNTADHEGFDLPTNALELVDDPISLKQLFMRYDLNGNGVMEKDEFWRLYKNTPELQAPGLEEQSDTFVKRLLYGSARRGSGRLVGGSPGQRPYGSANNKKNRSDTDNGGTIGTLTESATAIAEAVESQRRDNQLDFNEFAMLLMKLLQR